jgi:hypothetical protein
MAKGGGWSKLNPANWFKKKPGTKPSKVADDAANGGTNPQQRPEPVSNWIKADTIFNVISTLTLPLFFIPFGGGGGGGGGEAMEDVDPVVAGTGFLSSSCSSMMVCLVIVLIVTLSLSNQ